MVSSNLAVFKIFFADLLGPPGRGFPIYLDDPVAHVDLIVLAPIHQRILAWAGCDPQTDATVGWLWRTEDDLLHGRGVSDFVPTRRRSHTAGPKK